LALRRLSLYEDLLAEFCMIHLDTLVHKHIAPRICQKSCRLDVFDTQLHPEHIGYEVQMRGSYIMLVGWLGSYRR